MRKPVGTKPFPRRTVWLASIEYPFAFKSHDIANRLKQLADGESVADTDIKSGGTSAVHHTRRQKVVNVLRNFPSYKNAE